MKYDVFISYRREGGDTLAQLIYDRLTHRGYQVFLDIESLSGGKFNEKLLEVIDECKDIIVILPPNALDRCHNEGDWLYREIEHGISMKKNIIPVMMKNFVWPDNIPEAIADIQNYNGILDNKDYFDAVIDKITTLLTSKARFGGAFLKRSSERRGMLKQKATKIKRISILIAAMLLLTVGIGGFLYFKQNKAIEKAKNYAEITLTATEDMSASEYYDAIEIVKERFEILAEGYKYDFESKDDKIVFNVPMEVFHNLNVANTIKCYVSRPLEYSICVEDANLTSNGKQYFKLERKDIEKIELSEKNTTLSEDVEYPIEGLKDGEKCKSFALKINKKTFNKLIKWNNTKLENMITISQDVDENYTANFTYRISKIDKKTCTIYFVDNFQYENLFNLTKYNFMNESFSTAFNVSAKIPVVWENVEDENCKPGKNQCNEKLLDDNSIRIDLAKPISSYDKDVSDGEYIDIMRILKARLDALDTPYAFGNRMDDDKVVVLKISPEHLNEYILDVLGCANDYFAINSNFYKIVDNYDIESAEVFENEKGEYCIKVTPTSDWNNSEEAMSLQENMVEDESVYLSFGASNGVPLSKMSLSECYDGKEFRFDNVYAFGMEKTNKQNKYILDFIQAYISNDLLPYRYRVEDIFTYDGSDIEKIAFLEDKVSVDVQQNIEEELEKAEFSKEYVVEVSDIGQDVVIKIVIPGQKDFGVIVSDIAQEIYEILELQKGNIANTRIVVHSDSMNGVAILTFFSTDATQHKLSLNGYYSEEISEEYVDSYEECLNSQEFYKQFYIYDWYIKENGRISFK